MFPSFPCSSYSPCFSMRDCRNPQFVEPWWNNVQCTMYNANTKLTSFVKKPHNQQNICLNQFLLQAAQKGSKGQMSHHSLNKCNFQLENPHFKRAFHNQRQQPNFVQIQMEMGKSFPQTFVGVNVIVTTKPFKVAPFLTDWVNYKQIQPAMGLLPTTSIRNICHEFYIEEDHNNTIGMCFLAIDKRIISHKIIQ